ncbi:MAG: hypothetical protein KC582_00165 [Candidatus Magasanikbacteria bacterium]|nr:hypothetical protein [Candidatus Magasanikbacteria bacterium]
MENSISRSEARHVLASFMNEGARHPLFTEACAICRTTPEAVEAARKSVRGIERSFKGVILTPSGGRRRN